MLKIAFLCSGNGGNLRFVFEVISSGWLKDAEICGVITDRECLASRFAKEYQIPLIDIDFSKSQQQDVIEQLNLLNPDVIISTVHRILLPNVVDEFYGKLINLHYSLLPAFGNLIGVKPIKLALDYGVKFVGVTVHLVNTEVDAGCPIVQSVIPVMENDTTENLMDIVFECGCICLLSAIQTFQTDILNKSLKYSLLHIHDREIFVSPLVLNMPYNDAFWQKIKNYPLKE